MNHHTKKGISETRNWFILLVLVFLIVVLIKSIFGAAKNIKVSKENLKEAEAEYGEIYKRSNSIEDLLGDFEDDFGFEKYVRENFGVVRPGEKLVIIVNKNNQDKPRDESQGQD